MYQIYYKGNNEQVNDESYSYYADATYALQSYENAYIDSFLFDGYEERRGFNWNDVQLGNEILD